MLEATREVSSRILRTERKDNALYLYSEFAAHRLIPYTDQSIRISYTFRDAFSDKAKPGVIAVPSARWDYEETDDEIVVRTSCVTVRIQRETAEYAYYDNGGRLLLREAPEGRELESFTTTILAGENQSVEKVQTADGEKSVIAQARLVETGTAYHTRLKLQFENGEELYGLGQHEEGFGSLRGQTVYGHQANRKIAMPLLVSSKGYGLLVDTYSPYIFSDNDFDSYIYTEADEEMDFYFLSGGSMDGVIRQFRTLTGKASMLPKWAFGYWQSKERFESQKELEQVVAEYRRRNIPIDCIVLDWMSWYGSNWGQKTFDPGRFPAPSAMTENLHRMNCHFAISIWPNMADCCDDFKEHKENCTLLPGCDIYDAFSEKARKLYWKQAREGLFTHGIDAWWCDSNEPFAPEWRRKYRPTPSLQYTEYQSESAQHMEATMTNAYGFYHTMGICNNQRMTSEEKRVTILTRSGHTGSHRHGTILWSGDTAATWDTLRRQIGTGLGFCASGHPYWTMDIGAFFVKPGNIWFWKGDYDNTTEDLGYRELFVRWHQWGCFLPIFRGHGTDCHRELWHFGETGTPFYDAITKYNLLRYELMPYIYSHAGRTWLNDESMIRYLAFDYPDDPTACRITDQYLFGDSIMVCPVTNPMYYGVGSQKLEGIPTSRQVYLPAGKWYDFYTNEEYQGGQYITADAPLDKIPLFVKAGAIIPRAKTALSTAEQNGDLIIHVYSGADGKFTYYNDSGDGYGYEKGDYEVHTLRYSDNEKKLLPCDLLDRKNVTVRYI